MTPRNDEGLNRLEYHIMVALVPGAMHGYAIKDAIASESSGSLTPQAGSLYRVIARLIAQSLVAETAVADSEAHPGHARRYYELTAKGRAELAAEARRLKLSAALAERRLGILEEPR